MNQALAKKNTHIHHNGYLGDLILPGIDWAYFKKRRRGTLEQAKDLPDYLLLPEIEKLLSVTKNDTHHFLINTLFHTGARISEVLLLTRECFHFGEHNAEVFIPTLKQRKGRPSKSKKKPARRVLPLLDGEYIDEALRYFATNKGGKSDFLFTITRNTANRWVKQAVAKVINNKDVLFDDEDKDSAISPHTFRHSFAVNAVLHWIPLPVLQAALGHEYRENTEIYTQVFQAETAHFWSRVSYKS